MYTKQVIVLVLVGLVCSAGFALASPTLPQLFGLSEQLCDICKLIGKQVQGNLPELNSQFEQLCGLLGSGDLFKKCLDDWHSAESMIKNKTPEDICIQLGLCR